MNDNDAARSMRIAAFLARYRNAGIFSGLDTTPGAASPELEATADADGTPEQFVHDLEAMGPAFVKIGQALSTRPDMVPPDFMAALERMQSDVAPIPFEQIRAQIESELGVRVGRMFAHIEPEPIGSASLAQVHRATLRDGREVAVKVQRPDVEQQIAQDLDILMGIARAADRITSVGRRVHFSEWVREFRVMLLAELDYREEADNLERFAQHFADYPQLFVPVPLRDFCSRRVLTMSLVRGVQVQDIPDVRRIEQDMTDLAEALVRGYLDQVFIHGDIHADPHPGNLLLADDGRLAILDLGMVTHVAPRRRGELLQLLLAAVDGRGEDVAEAGIGMGTSLPGFDAAGYRREVSRVIARYHAHGGSETFSEGRMFFDMVRIATQHGLRMPPELSVLGKTLMNLETVALTLEPTLDRKRVVERHLERVILTRLRGTFSASRLANDALQMQRLMEELPGQVSKCLTLLAENRLSLRIAGLEESRLIENLQKIANRISAGVVTASLVIASAMLMRGDRSIAGTDYSTIVMLLFAAAGLIGAGLVLSALITDRRAGKRGSSTAGEDP
ncbi:MAG: AarF/ABC1/UbiB kinase family protein [Lysobacter sp.]|nr:AarF/ABC1/UbiB kinase family protein [Lysobacter sp.]